MTDGLREIVCCEPSCAARVRVPVDETGNIAAFGLLDDWEWDPFERAWRCPRCS